MALVYASMAPARSPCSRNASPCLTSTGAPSVGGGTSVGGRSVGTLSAGGSSAGFPLVGDASLCTASVDTSDVASSATRRGSVGTPVGAGPSCTVPHAVAMVRSTEAARAQTAQHVFLLLDIQSLAGKSLPCTGNLTNILLRSWVVVCPTQGCLCATRFDWRQSSIVYGLDRDKAAHSLT